MAGDQQAGQMFWPLCEVMGGGSELEEEKEGREEGKRKGREHREAAAQNPRLCLITSTSASES